MSLHLEFKKDFFPLILIGPFSDHSYKRKEDLFNILNSSANFYETNQTEGTTKNDTPKALDWPATTDVEMNESNGTRTKSMLDDLLRCESEFENCFEFVNEFESKYKTAMEKCKQTKEQI